MYIYIYIHVCVCDYMLFLQMYFPSCFSSIISVTITVYQSTIIFQTFFRQEYDDQNLGLQSSKKNIISCCTCCISNRVCASPKVQASWMGFGSKNLKSQMWKFHPKNSRDTNSNDFESISLLSKVKFRSTIYDFPKICDGNGGNPVVFMIVLFSLRAGQHGTRFSETKICSNLC